MPPIFTRQWRPISEDETDRFAGLGIRDARELSNSLNNYERHVAAFKVRSERFIEVLQSETGTTDEIALLPLLVPPTPTGFNYSIWTMRHYRSAGAGTVTWRLRSLSGYYDGPANPYDATRTSMEGTNIVTNAAAAAYSHGETKLLFTDFTRNSYLVLTSQASDSTTQAVITNLDITWRRR